MVQPKNGKTLREALNVKVVGKGSEALVLAHGFGGTQAHWEAVIPSLISEKDCRVILIDWPGACTTDVDDFDASIFNLKSLYASFAHMLVTLLQDELDIHSCTFVGHSMSAMVGCIAAVTHPSLFKKLVLVGASPRYLNDLDYYGGFEREDLEQLYEAIAADFGGWAAGFAASVVGVEAEQDAIDTFTCTLSSMRPEVALAMAKAIFESDFRGVVEELKQVNIEEGTCMEVHVLQTCKDVAVPLLVSDYFKRHLADSHGCLEILQTEGHLPHLSAPHLFSSALLRHLSDLSTPLE